MLTWVLDRALPVKFKAAEFNAKGSEVGIEELHLAHEGLRLERPGKGGLMSTPTPKLESLATAKFKTVKSPEPIEVTVHFNPASLQYTVSNTLKDEGSGSKKKQYVSQTSAKLTMDLVFDTTDTGQDVRETTEKIAKMLKAHGPSGKQVPPLVEFGWGVYRFTGMVEQYKETLDFFAAGGIPLRAGVNLTLSSHEARLRSARKPGQRRQGSAARAGDGADRRLVPAAGPRASRTRSATRAPRARSRRPTVRPACASPAAPIWRSASARA